MTYLLLQNTKEDILNANSTIFVHTVKVNDVKKKHWSTLTVIVWTKKNMFLSISFFVFHRRKKVIQILNGMVVTK